MSAAPQAVVDHHLVERLSHGLYGLVIITATLVAEQDHVDQAGDALGLLLGTAVVLLLVHTYTAAMAEPTVTGHSLGVTGHRLVVKDNLPVIFAVAGPASFLTMAAFDIIRLDTAYRLAIAFGIVALFILGVYEGRRASMKWTQTLLSGAAAGAIGLVVIAVEALFD